MEKIINELKQYKWVGHSKKIEQSKYNWEIDYWRRLVMKLSKLKQ